MCVTFPFNSIASPDSGYQEAHVADAHVADAGFEPALSFWDSGAYETPEIGHFSNPQY